MPTLLDDDDPATWDPATWLDEPWTPSPPPPPPQLAVPQPRRPRRRSGPLVAAIVAGLLGGAAGAGAVVAVTDRDAPTTTSPLATEMSTTATSPAASNGIQAVLAAVEPAVVTIHAEVSQRVSPFGRTVTGTAAGTGMIVTADGLVVTNAHVTEGARSVEVTLADGRTFTATVVTEDSATDVAVLQLEGASGLPTVTLASAVPIVGDDVVALGNALDLSGGLTVTTGIVSAVNRDVTTSTANLTELVQTDAAINSGNSGGPLAAGDGTVVGMNTAGAGEAQNIGFAVSASTIRTVLATAGYAV